MASTKKKVDMFTSEEGQRVRDALLLMQADSSYKTEDGYTADSQNYPDNRISFVDKHLHHLNTHTGTEPDQYLSNLRLMLRIRR